MSSALAVPVAHDERIVAPADIERVLEAMRRFEEFKRRALEPTDFVMLEVNGEKRPYVKKSGWAKYALACDISLELRDERVETRPDGSTVYHFTYRAVAPNGRYADAVGSASTKERGFAHPDHDARALAQTRAQNRAISNLIGGGELSAEELSSQTKQREQREQPPQQSSTPSQPKEAAALSTVEVKSKSGFPLATMHLSCDTVIFEPTMMVDANASVFRSFLEKRILAPLCMKYGGRYDIETDEDGVLDKIYVRDIKLTQRQIQDLTDAVRWTLEHAGSPRGN